MFGWQATFVNNTLIKQFTETEDNTKRLKEVLDRNGELETFVVSGGGRRIGINLKERFFIIGESTLPFQTQDGQPKLIYFMKRRVSQNSKGEYWEHPRIHFVGYENKSGSLLISLNEGTGEVTVLNELV